MTRRIFEAPALAEASLGEFAPGADGRSREEVRQYTRETGGTIHHPVGTGKMGLDPAAVWGWRARISSSRSPPPRRARNRPEERSRASPG
jgi:choline dehydrogenase